MNYQSNNRNQRPKGFKVKQAVQTVLLLAFCVWLVYQIMNSNDKSRHNGASMQNKFIEERGVTAIGRKGNAGWFSNRGGESDKKDVALVVVGEVETKEDGGVGDDELDRNVEEKADEESYNKDTDNDHGNGGSRDKEYQKKQETQYKEVQSIEDNKSDNVVGGGEAVSLRKDMYKEEYSDKGRESEKRSLPDRDDEKEPETQTEHTLIQDKDEAVKENDEDEGSSKIEEKTSVRGGGISNTSFLVQHEIEDDLHRFKDENGIPQDRKGIIEYIPTWATGNHKSIISRQIISSSDNQSGIMESRTGEGERVETKDGIRTADAESVNSFIQEKSENEETDEGKIDADSSVASGINHASERVGGKSIILDVLHSVSSQEEQKTEVVTSNSMFLQAE